MSTKGKAYIVGAFEHPTRKAPDTSLAQLHAEVAKGAIEDAGLSKDDIDGYFCAAGDTPGLGGNSFADYMGLRLKHIDTTDTGGSSYLVHVGHAAQAIAAGGVNMGDDGLAPRLEGGKGRGRGGLSRRGDFCGRSALGAGLLESVAAFIFIHVARVGKPAGETGDNALRFG